MRCVPPVCCCFCLFCALRTHSEPHHQHPLPLAAVQQAAVQQAAGAAAAHQLLRHGCKAMVSQLLPALPAAVTARLPGSMLAPTSQTSPRCSSRRCRRWGAAGACSGMQQGMCWDPARPQTGSGTSAGCSQWLWSTIALCPSSNSLSSCSSLPKPSRSSSQGTAHRLAASCCPVLSCCG